MVKACVSNFGRIDILCNIAGIDKPKMLFNMPEEDWDAVIAVHLKGTFNLTRHALPLMREQKFGRIINTVSDAFLAGPGHVNYSAAKGGIASLTYGVAAEMGRYGVTCNAFIPRARTRMVMDDAVIEGLKKRVTSGVWTQEQYDQKMKEVADPEYFATLLAYLASDAAANINGCIFLATGNTIGYWSKPEVIAQIDRNWEKDGRWPIEELEKLIPAKLLTKYVNPAPPQPDKK
jgi:NAD(P)-dependent dehydrogenase (short-subunit alcohol dehydrogenase family)